MSDPASVLFWLGLAADWLFEPSPTSRRIALIAVGCLAFYVCYRYLLRRAPADRDGFIEHMSRVFEAIGSRGLPQDTERVREIAARSYDRGHDPAASGRQLGAIIASGDRTAQLRRIKTPTLVIHGTTDRLVRPSGGRATARAIPGARLQMIEGMGHDMPRGVWPQLLDAISEHARAPSGHQPPTVRARALAPSGYPGLPPCGCAPMAKPLADNA